MSHSLRLKIIQKDDIWLKIELYSQTDTWRNIYTNQIIKYNNFTPEKLIKPYAKQSLKIHF